jgi:plastocyanin
MVVVVVLVVVVVVMVVVGCSGGGGDWVQFSKLLVMLAEEQTLHLQSQHKYTVQGEGEYSYLCTHC